MDKNKVKHRVILLFKAIPLVLIALCIISLVFVGVYKHYPVKTSPQMLSSKAKNLPDSIKLKARHQWIPLDSISQNLVLAVLAAEDRNFFAHNGFALKDSLDSTDDKGHFLDRKTISQQTSDCVFLNKGNSWIHRVGETYFTVLLEEFWDKNRILEVYLNSVRMGEGIFGAESAAKVYFNKKAGELTKDEASFLATTIHLNVRMEPQHVPDTIETKKKQILADMALMMNIKLGKKPIDESDNSKPKSNFRRKWRG